MGEFWRLRERVGHERRGGEFGKFEKGVSFVEWLLKIMLLFGAVDLKAKDGVGSGELESSRSIDDQIQVIGLWFLFSSYHHKKERSVHGYE